MKEACSNVFYFTEKSVNEVDRGLAELWSSKHCGLWQNVQLEASDQQYVPGVNTAANTV